MPGQHKNTTKVPKGRLSSLHESHLTVADTLLFVIPDRPITCDHPIFKSSAPLFLCVANNQIRPSREEFVGSFLRFTRSFDSRHSRRSRLQLR